MIYNDKERLMTHEVDEKPTNKLLDYIQNRLYVLRDYELDAATPYDIEDIESDLEYDKRTMKILRERINTVYVVVHTTYVKQDTTLINNIKSFNNIQDAIIFKNNIYNDCKEQYIKDNTKFKEQRSQTCDIIETLYTDDLEYCWDNFYLFTQTIE